MVKIFIGNLSQHAEKEEVEALFTQYGTVTECAKYKNYAFVHMEDRKSATKAIRELHLYKLNGRPINVELSRGNNQGPVKLHIANVEKGFDNELRELFEEYGTVSECAIIKNFAFVHMPNSDEAMDALKGLDNSEFQGKRIHVQISKSRPRGGPEEEFGPPPGRGGYYPPPPPHYGEHPEGPYGGRMSGYPPPPPPRRPMYLDRGYGERDGYVDYYEKFRAHPYGGPGYDERRPGGAIPPPPPPSAMVRERLGMGPADGFDRRGAPPPPPPPAPYMARDRSPIRRAPVPPGPPGPPAGNGYSYERSRLSPAPRTPMYPAPRPSFTERSAQPPPPPPQAAAAPRFPGY